MLLHPAIDGTISPDGAGEPQELLISNPASHRQRAAGIPGTDTSNVRNKQGCFRRRIRGGLALASDAGAPAETTCWTKPRLCADMGIVRLRFGGAGEDVGAGAEPRWRGGRGGWRASGVRLDDLLRGRTLQRRVV